MVNEKRFEKKLKKFPYNLANLMREIDSLFMG